MSGSTNLYGKPESISDMEKPKANGETSIETKTRPKVTNELSANIEALMPKLRSPSYYYTKPTIEELAAKERAEPGYIGRVKDFEVGRHGNGSIRFLGKVDLRGVDLENCFHIDPGRVAYSGLRPLAPQAFNDTAEMTLVTEKYTPKELESPYIQALVRWRTRRFKKEGEQFVCYRLLSGEYKWRTKSFSGLGLIGFKEKKETSKQDQDAHQVFYMQHHPRLNETIIKG